MLRKVEAIFCVALLVALILRMSLVSGSSMALVIILMSLAFVYFYFGFLLFTGVTFKTMFKKVAYHGIAGLRIIGAMFSGFALSIACVGLLFKLLSWPGAALDLVAGLVSCSVILLISFIKRNGKYAAYYKPIVMRMIIATSLCFFLLILPGKVFLEFMQRDNPGYVKALEAMWKDPGNENLKNRVREEQKTMHHH